MVVLFGREWRVTTPSGEHSKWQCSGRMLEPLSRMSDETLSDDRFPTWKKGA